MFLLKVLAVLAVASAGSGAGAGAGAGPAGCDVTVDATHAVTLNCSRRDLDSIPEQWPEEVQNANKDGHVLITFFHNRLASLAPLPRVPGARVALSLKQNRLRAVPDNVFQNLPNLVYLDLSKNSLTVLQSEMFNGPYESARYGELALESLNLGHNQVHSLPPDMFRNTPNMTRLYLNNNPLQVIDRVTALALSSAVNLEVLDLSNTELESIPSGTFKPLGRLQQLELSGNRFLAVPEDLTFVGDTLQYLNFNNNPIAELNDESFIGLTNLIQLEVGNNDNLEAVKRNTFTPLKKLRILHLCHNPNMRYISHNAFRGLKDQWTLKEVYLNENNLSELPSDLLPWRRLQTLSLSGNSWLCACELVDIVTAQGAGDKFEAGDTPYCAAPLKLSGIELGKVKLDSCMSSDSTNTSKKYFSYKDLKPKHVLWSIIGVAFIAALGMALGLLVNYCKAFYNKHFRSHPIRYVHILNDSSFA